MVYISEDRSVYCHAKSIIFLYKMGHFSYLLTLTIEGYNINVLLHTMGIDVISCYVISEQRSHR